MNSLVHYCLISYCSCSQGLSGSASLSHIPLHPHGHSKYRQYLLRGLQMSVICFLLLVQNIMINSELLIQRLCWNSSLSPLPSQGTFNVSEPSAPNFMWFSICKTFNGIFAHREMRNLQMSFLHKDELLRFHTS